jgi:hypothetical protein
MVAVGIIECCYVGNIVVSRDKTLAFCLAQLSAKMTTATTKRARWMARNTSEGKSKLVIRPAYHCEPPAVKRVAVAVALAQGGSVKHVPEGEGSVFGWHR